VVRLELAGEAARAERFWASLAPRLGWRIAPHADGWEVVTPGLVFGYVGGAGSRTTLVLQAPQGVPTAEEVRTAGGELLSDAPVVFADPVGTHIRLGS
jgi:hypothetical protein